MKGETGYRETAAALAVSRIFAEAAPLPDGYPVYGMQRFTVTVLSFLMTAAVYLPLYLVIRRTDGGIFEGISRRSRALSGFLGALFSAYLLFSAADTGLRAHYYTSSTIFDTAPSAYFYLFVGAALIFAVFKGAEAAMRTSVIIAGVFLLFLLIMATALIPEIDTDRLYPSLIDDTDSFAAELLREFSLNCELPLFAVLCGRVREKRGRTIPLYLVISCLVLLIMTFLYNTVFGYLVSKLSLPLYSLSSAADITVLHRVNGIDVMLWESAAIIRLALIALAFRETVCSCFTKGKGADIAAAVFAAVSLMLSELFTAYPSFFEPLKSIAATGIPLAAVAAVFPLFAVTVRRRKKTV